MAMGVSPSSGMVQRIISIEIIVGWDRFLGLYSFQNCSFGTDCCTVVWDLNRMILVVYCACCFLSLEIEIQFLCVIACLNNMKIV